MDQGFPITGLFLSAPDPAASSPSWSAASAVIDTRRRRDGAGPETGQRDGLACCRHTKRAPSSLSSFEAHPGLCFRPHSNPARMMEILDARFRPIADIQLTRQLPVSSLPRLGYFRSSARSCLSRCTQPCCNAIVALRFMTSARNSGRDNWLRR